MGSTRVVVFVDYQNAYRAARRAFHDDSASPAPLGQFHPDRLGEHIAASGQRPGRVLEQVRVYRGMPDSSLDSQGNGAARRQVAAWQPADPARQRYRLRLKGGSQPRCNWISEDIYRRSLADDRDYNQARPRNL